MSRCRVCGEDKNFTCICGFCQDCIAKHTHQGCIDEVGRDKQEEE